MNKTVIDACGVYVTLGSTPILEDVNFRVSRGESVALIGQNGSGKSTLLRAITSIVPLTHGSITLFDGHAPLRQSLGRVGYVPQRFARSGGVPATAFEVVRTGLLRHHSLGAHRGKKAREHVQVFSGGQMQRVMIARALIREPELLLLDEPLAGIDRSSREALAAIMSDLRDQGITMVTILHEMGELAPLVDRTIELESGHIIYDGIPRSEDECHHNDTHHDHHEDHDTRRTPHHSPNIIRRSFP